MPRVKIFIYKIRVRGTMLTLLFLLANANMDESYCYWTSFTLTWEYEPCYNGIYTATTDTLYEHAGETRNCTGVFWRKNYTDQLGAWFFSKTTNKSDVIAANADLFSTNIQDLRNEWLTIASDTFDTTFKLDGSCTG